MQRILPALQVVRMPVPLPGVGFRQAMQWHKYRIRDLGLVWLYSLLLEAAQHIDAVEGEEGR